MTYYKVLLAILFPLGILLAQSQTIQNISYTKHTTMYYSDIRDIDHPFFEVSFNADHDLGHVGVQQYVNKTWASIYKFSLSGLPPNHPIKKVTIKAYITEKEYDDNCFVARLGIVNNNATNLLDAASVYSAVSTEFTNFKYKDTITYNMAGSISQQHIQDGYFLVKVWSNCSSLNSTAKISP